MRGCPEPCPCGALDCRRCHPENFRDGKYKYKTCPRCEEVWVPDEDAEPPYYCDQCVIEIAEEKESTHV